MPKKPKTKKQLCAHCGKNVGSKKVSEQEKMFCCIACCDKWKKGHTPKVCEFC